MIIDASVAAKWFLKGEEWEEESLRIKNMFENGGIDLSAPSIILYEVGNTIWKRKDISSEIARKLVEKAFEYLRELIVLPSGEIANLAMRIAREYNITFYDAIYIALSKQRKEIFITADKKLYNKVKNSFLVKFIADI